MYDPEYDEEEQAYEDYNDPEFENVWNSDEEYEKDLISPRDIIGENLPLVQLQAKDPQGETEENGDKDEWEEV